MSCGACRPALRRFEHDTSPATDKRREECRCSRGKKKSPSRRIIRGPERRTRARIQRSIKVDGTQGPQTTLTNGSAPNNRTIGRGRKCSEINRMEKIPFATKGNGPRAPHREKGKKTDRRQGGKKHEGGARTPNFFCVGAQRRICGRMPERRKRAPGGTMFRGRPAASLVSGTARDTRLPARSGRGKARSASRVADRPSQAQGGAGEFRSQGREQRAVVNRRHARAPRRSRHNSHLPRPEEEALPKLADQGSSWPAAPEGNPSAAHRIMVAPAPWGGPAADYAKD